jgi:ParB-like chromosome segregation protein Spo0J
MQVERIEIAALCADPANVRVHPRRNIDAIKASLIRFGQQKPIVVDARNVVRAGNGTLRAARELEWTHLDVVRTPLEAVEATAFGIADNRTAELAEWDEPGLSQLLDQPGLGDVGFSSKEIEKLAQDPPPATSETSWNEQFQIVVECTSEEEQKNLYERFIAEGLTCRLLVG